MQPPGLAGTPGSASPIAEAPGSASPLAEAPESASPLVGRRPGPRRPRVIAGAAAIVALVAGGTLGAAILAGGTGHPAGASPSGHAAALASTPGGSDTPGLASATPSPASTPTPAPTASPISADPAAGSPDSLMRTHLAGDVYGFLPSWEMDADILASLDWNALSTLALFAVDANPDGSLITTHPGYRAIESDLGRQLIATATSRGVHTEITFTTFGVAHNAAFFASAPAQATAIAALRALVADVGAGGVDVDAELIQGTYFPAYATFCANLRAALRQDNPTATVTVATNGATSGAKMAKAALAAGADRAFLMGYSYRSAGTTPGGIAPLDRRGGTSNLDLLGSLDIYTKAGVPLDRVIMGLPLYGMRWPTAGPALGDARTGPGTVYVPRRHLDELAAAAAAGTIALDPVESVDWFASQDPVTGAWSQTFLDTPRSLGPKLTLALTRKLAGIGFWTLGYDRGTPGYWSLVQGLFGRPQLLAVSGVPTVTNNVALSLAIAAIPGSRPIAGYQVSTDGTTWSPATPLPELPVGAGPGDPRPGDPRPGATATLPAVEGARTLRVRLIDDTGVMSAVQTLHVTLDLTAPLMHGTPLVRWSASKRAWRATWTAATDASGIAGYQVRVRVGAGPWRVVAPSTTATALWVHAAGHSGTVRVAVLAVDKAGNRAAGSSVGIGR